MLCLPKVIPRLSLVSLCAWGVPHKRRDLTNEEQDLIVFIYQVIVLHNVGIARLSCRDERLFIRRLAGVTSSDVKCEGGVDGNWRVWVLRIVGT
jgi:hypothetical protein